MKVREQLREAVLIFSSCGFHHVDARDQTKVFDLGSKHLYPLSHLGSPLIIIHKILTIFLGLAHLIVLADC